MANVTLKNIRKSYGKTQVLHGIDLDINDGEFLVLVGPSGCGKSTLLRIIAGLEETSGGEVYIGDNLVNDVEPKNRDIAMVFQNYALYPHMTVFENMAFGLKLKKMAKVDIEKRVNEAAEILDIREYLERRPKELSGGQRQRVAVGRSIVRKPAVFLFDEPLSNLDAKLRVQMRTELKILHEKLKTTMVYVTHDQVEAMTMGERIVVMKEGHIFQADQPLNIYNNPANEFVASFIGSPAMNFIDATVKIENTIHLRNDFMDVSLPSELNAAITPYEDKQIRVGIRPEHLSISHNTDTGIKVCLEISELMGNESYLYTSAGDFQLVARVQDSEKRSSGDQIILSPLLDHLHFFDLNTGVRLQ
ncbi:MAG: sn-glycerol-3-phosphate ABC transporter ATP-binding protein UgpC [Candidatus Marinimicrobia bacterium]|nr:sn-glycerol-3-phosphate ABC transporter ATP-binding protein UgpC [Candidatus Neomarinimicrobiota bacterium]MCF7850946.1 sn-glycerol-3-phosphate ABC transporter ATP-binding protein UgpC [Candidatus Neomarinimicrobiota bacterium]